MSTLLSTTLTAPRSIADTMLSLTDTLPALSLDVAEDPASAENYRYTFFLPPDAKADFLSALDTLPQALFQTALSFDDVDTSIDYIAQNRAAFPPLTIGPFFVARNDEDAPAGLIKLDIMPNRAFGSGEHATTTGCLLAYTHLIQSGHSFATGLDFGAGSGILAIAAAKQHGTPFLCIDNDEPSVIINEQNGQLNGVANLLACEVGEVPPSGQTFNLIFANILLQPLLDLSSGLAACMAPGASLILSGFTTDQSGQIAACYSALGLQKTWEHQQGDWLAQIWSAR